MSKHKKLISMLLAIATVGTMGASVFAATEYERSKI